MNQNRNNNNRRRGRGNNRGGGGNQSNRIDSRARGNAPQMLEKYRKLAHDASLNDDRVQTEYYLQFADHYFRVVADMRSQKDDPRGGQRGNDRNPSDDDDYDDDNDRDDGREIHSQGREQEQGRDHGDGRDQGRGQGRDQGRDQGRSQNGNRRNTRRDRDDRDRDERDGDDGVDGPVGIEPQRGMEGDEADGDNPFIADTKPKRARRKKPEAGDDAADQREGINASVLPPSIGKSDDAAPRKPLRARRPRKETLAEDSDGDGPLEAVG